ncbi:MAG: hypothetical protein AAFV25_22625 [Bacteroidota bacterium]
MKRQYFIRRVGWAYDDSDYVWDQLHGIVDCLDNREEADDYARYLNREQLIKQFEYIERHDTWGMDGRDRWQHLSALVDFLVDEMGFNPTLALHPRRLRLSPMMFVKAPSDELLDRLLDLLKLRFYQVVEFDKTSDRFLQAKTSTHYSSYAETLSDYHENSPLCFSNEREAMGYFHQKRAPAFVHVFNQQLASVSNLEELSDLPLILKNFTEENPFLSKDNGQWQLSARVDAETLLGLNALLKFPFLIYEEVPDYDKNELEYKEANRVLRMNELLWKKLETRLQQFPNEEALLSSEAYLSQYLFPLSAVHSSNGYADVLAKELSRMSGRRWQMTHHRMTDGSSFLHFYGLISKMQKVGEEYRLETLFGVGKREILAGATVGIGQGKNLQKAFCVGLRDWLQRNENLILQELQKKSG